MPADAQKLKYIPHCTVPYISPTDLIVFKINSCGLRAQASKKRTHAADAQALLELETRRHALSLTVTQREIVEPCIADVVKHGNMSEEWWRERLGLSTAGSSGTAEVPAVNQAGRMAGIRIRMGAAG